jgi:predicted metal-binding membrane protein
MPDARAPGGAVESLLRRDGLIVAGAMSVLVLIAALYTVFGLGMNMSAIEMTRMAGRVGEPMAMAMQPRWTAGYALLVFLMWWVMMIAMMTPSASPFVLLFAAVKRTGPEADRAALHSGLLLAGYLAGWAAFSAAATLVQWTAESAGLASGAMMTLDGRWLAALVLIAAGLYQFTPVKSACLRHCRAPGQFLAEHRRPGAWGAFRMGTEHGAYCLGCCWALMALLFVGGIMNLVWIAGLTVYVLIEKLLPRGEVVARVAGGLLVALGGWLLVT